MAHPKCARCGEDWALGYDRCWNCGHDTAQVVLDAVDTVCASCGGGLEGGDQFCPECGAPVPVRTVAIAPPLPADDPEPRRRRFGLMEVGLIAVALAVLATSIYSVRPTPNRRPTVTGTLTLFQPGLVKDGDSCLGVGEYDHLAPGKRVTVRNQDDETIAIAELQPSAWLGPEACRFPFAIPDLPRASSYVFTVNDHEHVEYSRSQLEDAGWRVFMIAGEPAQV